MDAKLLALKIVKNIAKTQTGEFKGGVIYFINEAHGVKLGDDAPTVVLGRGNTSQCIFRIDDLASHNGHVPGWEAGVAGKDEAAMKTYITRVTSDIEAKAAAYEYVDPQQATESTWSASELLAKLEQDALQGVNLADADEVSEATSDGVEELIAEESAAQADAIDYTKWTKAMILLSLNVKGVEVKPSWSKAKMIETIVEWNTKNG